MNILRTPDSQFENLPNYPFKPNYVEVDGLRIHYVDEGNNDDEVVLMLHGEPSWSYLYRKMIPVVAAAGYRAIAPDLVGFGKSDKLPNTGDYSYQKFVDWMTGFIKGIGLKNITLFCQDWGGLIGLRLAAENPELFKRIVVSNTFLPIGKTPKSEAFLKWQAYSQKVPVLNVGKIVNGGSASNLTPEEVAAYNAPYPDESYKAAARIFPSLVPTTPNDPAVPANLKAWEVLKKWDKPFLTAFGDSDPITRGGDRAFQKLVPGTKGQAHTTVKGGGHFIQEDKGEELGQIIIDFIKAN